MPKKNVKKVLKKPVKTKKSMPVSVVRPAQVKLDFDLLNKLMDIDGVSGNEMRVREFIMNEIKPYVDVIRVDKLGNLICHKKGNKPSLMLAAHMDEIGLMVKRIEKDGRIYVSAIGGITTLNVIGETVAVMGGKKPVKGIISTKEISNDDDITELPEMKNVFVDTGLSGEALEKLGIGVGSYLSLERVDHGVGNTEWVAGKALDDRIGCFVLLQLAKHLRKCEHDIYLVFTVQEEVGLYGAKVSAYQVNPDMAVAVDVSSANDVDGDNTICIGKGPVLTMKDDEMIGNTCMNNFFRAQSKKLKAPIQLEVTDLGTTDALTISLSKGGVPATSLGVCVRNIHTTHSIASKKDIVNLYKLLLAMCYKPPVHCVE